jgi:hypothetical protein
MFVEEFVPCLALRADIRAGILLAVEQSFTLTIGSEGHDWGTRRAWGMLKVLNS